MRQRRNRTIGLANSLRATGTGSMPPVWDSLASLRSPLLAVAGALDGAYVEHASHLADVCPFGTRATVAGAGHALPLEDPSAVATLLGEFLESCDGRGRP